MATFTNTPEKSPAITVNNYGKGRAIYVAVPAQMAVLRAARSQPLRGRLRSRRARKLRPAFTPGWSKEERST